MYPPRLAGSEFCMGPPQLQKKQTKLHSEQIHGNGPMQLLAFCAVGRLRMHGRQLGEERLEKQLSLSHSLSLCCES